MKNIKFKVSIFVLSLVISIIIAELLLQKIIRDVNLPRVYHDVAEFNLYDKEQEGKERYFRDQSQEVYQSNEKTEVICLGDSFTNGGNTFWDNTYPYKLFLRFNKQVTVRNLGVCSSTTLAVSRRLEEFFNGPEYDSSKKYIISIMIGAADIFSRNLEIISEIDNSKFQKWHNMELEQSKKESLLEKIYFFRVLKILSVEIYNRLIGARNSLLSSTKFNQEIQKCAISPTKKFICLKELISNNDDFADLKLDLKEHLVMRYLSGDMAVKSSEISKIIFDFLEMVKVHPRYLEKDYFVMDLMGLAKLQDKITIRELGTFILEHSKGINPKSELVNGEMVKNAIISIEEFDNLNVIRDMEWNKIKKIAKKYNAKLIVMNYPVAYKSTNDYLATMSKKNNLTFLDTERIFTERNNTKEPLLDDWEHCSPKGYDLIAELLFNQLESLR